MYCGLIRILRFVLIVVLMILLFSCKKDKSREKTILAKIADKTISVDEFIRRAEYTIRPPYCNSSSTTHKKIILNSLIAEKLMSCEVGDAEDLMDTKPVQNFLLGRKEQAMRQVQFFRVAYDRAVVDTPEVKKYWGQVGRTYRIEYYNILDSLQAKWISRDIKNGKITFDEAYRQSGLFVDVPKREVNWNTIEHEAILEALFGQEVRQNQIIGPVKIADDQFTLIRIMDWSVLPVITEKDHDDRWRLISERIRQNKARDLYNHFIAGVMKGKSIQFSPQTFLRFTTILGPYYFLSDQEKQELTKNQMFDLPDKRDGLNYQQFHQDIEQIADAVLFEVDGKKYTVRQLIDEIDIHPLVFRKNKMQSKEFGKQLQWAIMDLVRDKFLTGVAYQEDYDQLSGIIREVDMWKDNLQYEDYVQNYVQSLNLDSTITNNPVQLINRYLNNRIDSLQKKYSDRIEINLAELDRIKLTDIDMNVQLQNVPYTEPVPRFPLVTTNSKLDYGKKMKAEK